VKAVYAERVQRVGCAFCLLPLAYWLCLIPGPLTKHLVMKNSPSGSGVTLSTFARSLAAETAFDVLAVAKRLKAQGKDVVELQIGDSPFPTPPHAAAAGIRAIEEQATHYCASLGLPAFREVIARHYQSEFGVAVTEANVVVASGAKVFEQFFCEAVLDPGDAVLVFSPQFPTYVPNINRRGGKVVYSVLRQENQFRPDLNDVRAFLRSTPNAKAIFLNSPHNPTGGVATHEDLRGLADLIRGRNIAVFSDEPYCHMVWEGKHHTLLAEDGVLDQVMAAYTFSKSYSMSGWRIGYAVSNGHIIETIGKMINTTLSCVPPLVQWAGQAALEHDGAVRDDVMAQFHQKVRLLVEDLRRVNGVQVVMPAGTFYVFPDVRAICQRLGILSHGLAMYLLEGADDSFGVACLGGECFGPAGQGFLRFSCAEPDGRLHEAMAFFADAITRTDRVERYLAANPKYREA
jgi:aspartate aminotransferase